ncbi:MAG: hypothetical protein ACU0CO_02285 [Shimia sp.]
MSDAMTNAGLEDVLSSIRRLVAEERPAPEASERPAARPAAPSAQAAEAGGKDGEVRPEALVLTQDARVAQAAPDPTPVPAPEARPEAAREAVPATTRPEAPKAEPQPTPSSPAAPASQPTPAARAAAPKAAPSDVARNAKAELERAIAELEALLSRQDDTSTDTPPTEAQAEEGPADLDWDAPVGEAKPGPIPTRPAEAAPTAEAPFVEAEPEAEDIDPTPHPALQQRARHDWGRRTAAAVAEVIDADPTPEAKPARPATPQDRDAASKADTQEAGVDEPVAPMGLPEDDAVDLDEGALRDLVAEIVRSELQGELGERITRNVRKLVRREIHRAMASKDLI